MRVCFVVSEIFAFGRHGGFGKLTRDIANGLAAKGVEVFVLVRALSPAQRKIEIFDNGITVIKLPRVLARLSSIMPLTKTELLYKLSEADVYHSEAVLIDSWLCMKHNPDKKHVINFQDPRYFHEMWEVEKRELPNLSHFNKWDFRARRNLFGFFEKRAVKRADRLYCQAKFIIPKVTKMYNLPESRIPEFLPNPVRVPERKMRKADVPTVCFLGRWDPVKRPEIFFSLAKRFPDVKFIALGKAHEEKRDQSLREKHSDIPNLEMPGFKIGEEKSKILEKSWILINTSFRECLPVSFLEATANKCAILSSNNPDDFARSFGYHVTDGDFAKGLKFLLENDRWKERGELGYKYVKKVHELNHVIDMHVETYKGLF